MDHAQELKKHIAASFRLQKVIFYGMGIFTALTGVVLLILMTVIPPKPGEEQVVFYLKITSVVFLAFGVWSWWYVDNRIRQTMSLVFDHPTDIERIVPFQVQRRGIVAFAVRLYPKRGKMIGLNVIGPKSQAKLIELLSKQAPQAQTS